MTPTQRIVVGIDGGATHATALVVNDAGEELARTEGGPGLVNPMDPAACVGRLAVLARRAIAQAGVFAPVHSLCCALAGAGRPELRDAVRAELAREQIARHVGVTTDAEAALADAFAGGPGILLIAGTGSIAWGRGEDGRLQRCGGWGLLLGDEGSGYAVGLAGLQAVVRADDGRGPATALTDTILAQTKADAPDALIGWSAGAGKAGIAALAPLVLEHADHDAVAAGIRDSAAEALARHVAVLAAALGPWRGHVDVALAGGLIRPGGPLRNAVTDALGTRVPTAHVLTRVIDAARGATRLAQAAHAG